MDDRHDQTLRLKTFLFEQALPLWWQRGADRAAGGYYEKLDFDGAPADLPRRARVVTRQAFCYCEAGRLGWTGPWREAALHALDYFRKHFVTDNGTVVSVVAADGRVIDKTFDLYDQAFALLAYAHAHRCFGADGFWRERAIALREALQKTFAHPQGGFFDAVAGGVVLRSNPHMHLLESALSWMAIDADDAWRRLADGIAGLCEQRFIDPASGAVREFFDKNWAPAGGAGGHLAEPGHQYEWAFLLDWWAVARGRARPDAVARLIAFADTYGLDAGRGVAINSVLTDGSIQDSNARLWPQTERIRAYAIERRPRPPDAARLSAAVRGLRCYLDGVKPGLWRDEFTADRRFVGGPPRATNLYHIVGAVAALI